MAHETYPELELGGETGASPARLRLGGRYVTVVGAVVDGAEAYFDNGVLAGKSKAEQGITFGGEVLRALGGRRVLVLWMAAARDEHGRTGWIGLTVGEMRIDAARKDGFRDLNAFQTKLTDAAQGRVAVWQMKDPEKEALLGLLGKRPDLWRHGAKSFRETVLAAAPGAAALDGAAAPDGDAPPQGAPEVCLGTAAGYAPSSFRAFGRDVTVVGILVEGAGAAFDNAVLQGKSRAEQGIRFGPEPMRAVGGKRFCAVFLSVARDEEGKPGWFGATVSEMRVDAAKKDGFKDLAALGMKLNDSARGRVEIWRLKPEERQAVGDLLRGEAALWEAASENIRAAVS